MAKVNPTEIANRQEDLLRRLQEFNHDLRTDFSSLQAAWHDLDSVWGGYAYDRFSGDWEQTVAQFQAYLSLADHFETFLRGRIAANRKLEG
jgi:hypothetical protein